MEAYDPILFYLYAIPTVTSFINLHPNYDRLSGKGKALLFGSVLCSLDSIIFPFMNDGMTLHQSLGVEFGSLEKTVRLFEVGVAYAGTKNQVKKFIDILSR